MCRYLFLLAALATNPITLFAQAPGAMQATSPTMASATPASAPANGGMQSAVFGDNNTPGFDPGSNIATWNGQHWNVNNNVLARARFEKFLNASEQSESEFNDYQAVMKQISDLLNPTTYKPQNLTDAWVLLQKASQYPEDAGLSGTLADAVHTAWLAQGEQARLKDTEMALRKAREDSEWNLRLKIESSKTARNMDPSGKVNNDPKSKVHMSDVYEQEATQDLATGTRDIAEQTADITATKLKGELTLVQAKLTFQSYVLQLFTQRRFQHVVIASNFYKYVFGDGDTRLQVSQQAQDALTGGSGLPATMGVLETLSVDAIRDVKEGVDSSIFLLNKGKLTSATEQLQQALVEGEYLPELHQIPRDTKTKIADYADKENQLLSAIDVKDYTTAQSLVDSLKSMSSDFDATKPNAAINTAKIGSSLHLAKAQNAAMAGDKATFEAELKEAGDIWPTNPDLAKVAGGLLTQQNTQQQALNQFDQLVNTKNYRQIWDDKGKYIAATSQDNDRQAKLNDILNQMQDIEMAIARATELQKHSDPYGAWEAIDAEAVQYPNDPKLNQLRAQLTTDAADFVHAIRTAQDLEKKDQWGSALAMYLKAQATYPPSQYAQAGIDNLTKKVMSN